MIINIYFIVKYDIIMSCYKYVVNDKHTITIIQDNETLCTPTKKFNYMVINYILENDDDFKDMKFEFKKNPKILSFNVDLLIPKLDIVLNYNIGKTIDEYRDKILYGYGYDILSFNSNSNIVDFLDELMKKIETRKLMYYLDHYENLIEHGDIFNLEETHKNITFAEEEYEKCREKYIFNILKESSADLISPELLKTFIRYAKKDDEYIFPSSYVLKHVKCPFNDIKNGKGITNIKKILDKFNRINGETYYITNCKREIMLNCSGFKLFGMKTSYDYGYIIALWYEKIEKLCYDLIEHERISSYHDRRLLRDNIKYIREYDISNTTSIVSEDIIDDELKLDDKQIVLNKIEENLIGKQIIEEIPELVYGNSIVPIKEMKMFYDIHKIRKDIDWNISFETLLDKIKKNVHIANMDNDILINVVVNANIINGINDVKKYEINQKIVNTSSYESESSDDEPSDDED